MAGTFSRRLRAFCAKSRIEIIEAQAGERKHELAEPHLPTDPKFRGLFLVIAGNAPAPVWEVKRNCRRPDRRSTPSQEVAIRQALPLSPDGSGLGPRDHPHVRLSALRRPGDLEWPRVGRAPGPAPTPRGGQERQLFCRGQRFCGGQPVGGALEPSPRDRTLARGLRAMDLHHLPELCADTRRAGAQPFRLSVFDIPVGAQPQPAVPAWQHDERGVSEAHRPHQSAPGSCAVEDHLRPFASPASKTTRGREAPELVKVVQAQELRPDGVQGEVGQT